MAGYNFINYLKNVFKVFGNSFKLDLSFLYSILLDLLFYLSIFFTYNVLYNIIMDRTFELMSMSAVDLGIEQIGMMAKSFMLKFYLMVVVGIVLFIFFYGIFKSLVWAMTLKSKMNKKYMQNFSMLSSIGIIFWGLITYLIIVTVTIENTLIMLFFFLFINYFTKILFTVFSHHKSNIKKSLNSMVDIAFKKFHLFIIPYVLEFAVFLVLFIILVNFKFLPLRTYLIIIFFIFLIYFAWARKYFSSVVKGIIK